MTRCPRCGNETNITIMSKFNRDIICMPCKERERAHPKYKEADEAEVAAVRAGVKNFRGIGCPRELYLIPPTPMTLEEYETEYARLSKWRERWMLLSNKHEPGRLAKRQEAIERRAAIVNDRIGVLLRTYARQQVPELSAQVSNHVFTCSGCNRQYTIHSPHPLECFFIGLCYWCITEHKLTKDQIDVVLRRLLKHQNTNP